MARRCRNEPSECGAAFSSLAAGRGTAPNDLPLAALCRGLEIDLRGALGEADLPPPLRPEDYALL